MENRILENVNPQDTPGTLGIVGAGHIAQAVARHASRAGYQVTISSRKKPAELADLASSLGERVKAGTPTEAAQTDLVLIAVHFDQIPEAVKDIDWKGRTVIDTSNAIVFPEFKPKDLGGMTSSRVNANLFPGASLVKAFNTLPAAVLASDPNVEKGKRVIFVSGDDAESKKKVLTFAKDLSFYPIDLGGLDEGGRLQEFGGALITHNLIKLK